MYNNGNSSKNVTGASVVDGTLENADFPDDTISGDKIDGGTISNFTSTGIDDNASAEKVDITDSIVDVLTGANLRAVDGILFGSDTAAANALDDYEEGTWTPTYTSTSVSWSYASQYGSYVKVGGFVQVQFYLNAEASGTTSNSVTLSGLPYTSANLINLHQNGGGIWFSGSVDVQPLVRNNTTTANLWKQGFVATCIASDVSNNYFVGTLTYRAS